MDLLSGFGVSIGDVVPVVENIVVNGSIETEVELAEVAVALGMAKTEYEPEQFPGLVYRTAALAAVLLFRSGAFIITGLTNYGDVWDVARDFTKKLDKIGIPNVVK